MVFCVISCFIKSSIIVAIGIECRRWTFFFTSLTCSSHLKKNDFRVLCLLFRILSRAAKNWVARIPDWCLCWVSLISVPAVLPSCPLGPFHKTRPVSRLRRGPQQLARYKDFSTSSPLELLCTIYLSPFTMSLSLPFPWLTKPFSVSNGSSMAFLFYLSLEPPFQASHSSCTTIMPTCGVGSPPYQSHAAMIQTATIRVIAFGATVLGFIAGHSFMLLYGFAV